MHKSYILLLAIFLVGCSTVPDIQLAKEIKQEQLASIPAPVQVSIIEEPAPVSIPAPAPALAPAPAPAPQPTPLLLSAPLSESIPFVESLVKEKLNNKIVNKVKTTIVNVAESAIEGKSETITYDANGDIKEKTITVEKGSLVENITKLLGLITATIGLYIGVKKFRHLTSETTGA